MAKAVLLSFGDHMKILQVIAILFLCIIIFILIGISSQLGDLSYTLQDGEWFCVKYVDMPDGVLTKRVQTGFDSLGSSRIPIYETVCYYER